ncbi:MAG TPA: primosomal protein N', partial [Gammaproteobacteria bacterium]|nr:primosomal protein N' [Gammaproteobacteria bacterium]
MSSNSPSHSIAEIALPTRVADSFDYRINASDSNALQPGCRVRIEFGRRQMVGVVIKLKTGSDFPAERLKTIRQVIDTQPVIPAKLLELMQRGAAYYHHPLGEVVFTGLPKRLREGASATADKVAIWTALTLDDQASLLKRAPKQLAVLRQLQASPAGLATSEVSKAIPAPNDALRALERKGLVRKHFQQPGASGHTPSPADSAPKLTTEQQNALAALLPNNNAFAVNLLDGVTGSGKTEVYLNLVAPVIAEHHQVLVLVPEISLTPQLVARFSARFPGKVVSYHSGLNETEKFTAWRQAANAEAGIVLGTRSALFLPIPKLGYIIIDEEHDPSLKQGEGFRYHARDLAIFRGQIDDIPVLLGSATPSLETLANVERGRYGCVRLTHRAGDAHPPALHLVDLKRQNLQGGLSQTLIDKMHSHLERHHQVLLFLNRRGYAPAMLCHECGFLVDCPRCDAHMTWHASHHALHCHHCGHVSKPPQRCPDCGKAALQPIGAGTQKIEDVIHACFPENSVIRIDRDSMRHKHALDDALREIREGRHQIIIGTQMLAKGHDFPNITLVGMIEVDQGLFSSDFRAAERVAQQVMQVSGRAGRGKHAGEVVIQTMQPEHPLLQTLLHDDYRAITDG